MGAVRGLFVREDEAPAGEIAQPGGVTEDLDAGLTVPDQDIAALRLDDRSPGRG